MRRRLLRFLPVFLLALAVQILAPVGACLARAAVATDPLASMVLCQGAAAGDATDRQQNHHMRDGSCAVCAAAVAFAAADPQPVPVMVSRHIYRVVWRAYAPDTREAKIAAQAQARGPPKLS